MICLAAEGFSIPTPAVFRELETGSTVPARVLTGDLAWLLTQTCSEHMLHRFAVISHDVTAIAVHYRRQAAC